MVNQDKQQLNESFWAFLYLIVNNPERYLTIHGKFIYKIVSNGGSYKSISRFAREWKLYKPKAKRFCCGLIEEGHIEFKRVSNRKEIVFNDVIIKNGLQFAKNIIR